MVSLEKRVDPAEDSPMRTLGGLGSFAFVAGSMLGIGIFLAPSMVAERVGSVENFYWMWICGGVVALAGAVSYAELGRMLPRSGGDYVFQKEAFGDSIAFASGWLLFLAVFGGSIAAVAVGLCDYQFSSLVGLDLSKVHILGLSVSKILAIWIVLGFTFLNRFQCGLSGLIQGFLTIAPIGLLVGGCLYGFIVFDGNEIGGAGTPLQAGELESEALFFGFVMAYLPIYFAFSGWNGVVYLAGEVKNPDVNLPYGLILGTLTVTLLYLLLCAGFVHVIGWTKLHLVNEAGSEAAGILGGFVARTFITICIVLGLLASLNGTILGGARVAYAMACDRVLWSGFSSLSVRSRVPERALWLQAIWACLLIMTESFEVILDLVSLAMLLSGSLTVFSLFVLRRKFPRKDDSEDSRLWRLATKVSPFLFLMVNFVVMGGIALESWHGGMDDFVRFLGVILFVLAFLFHRLGKVSGGIAGRSPVPTLTSTKFD